MAIVIIQTISLALIVILIYVLILKWRTEDRIRKYQIEINEQVILTLYLCVEILKDITECIKCMKKDADAKSESGEEKPKPGEDYSHLI